MNKNYCLFNHPNKHKVNRLLFKEIKENVTRVLEQEKNNEKIDRTTYDIPEPGTVVNQIAIEKKEQPLTFGDLHKSHSKEINDLLNWVQSLIPHACWELTTKDLDQPKETQKQSKKDAFEHVKEETEKGVDDYYGGDHVGYNFYRFGIEECWTILFSKGEGVPVHNHFPYPLTFCYYVKKPKGSPNVFIEGEEIEVRAGQVMFLLGNQNHSVPPCLVKDRCVIVGNILYKPRNTKLFVPLS